ncbi:DUF2971 domain-containing protein [Vallitalea guaymasensis]|uniref:DUF2971 domain-containing protein n=1 Tax=Vallitalea guaymasensis TaxID=1185412 RepID=A0A8J8MDY4_9FIRM|nr:DUF2971 domain-containing protein [Vallitalea guaymasensis]QUH31146.1 DUF2971 domain-containing protein [Vallitalea guaymasensis]
MSFTFTDWKHRIRNRADITGMVTHLTKPSELTFNMSDEEINLKAVGNLIKILEDKRLNGSDTSSGFIVGKRPVVCFQDAPLHGIIQNVEYELEKRNSTQIKKIRYCGIGLSFSKFYVYTYGGRPVIYDNTIEAKKYLPEEHYWRIVNFILETPNPKIIDWTHEREWRVPDEFIFKYNYTHVVLYDKATYDYFLENCSKEIINKLHGITILKSLLM